MRFVTEIVYWLQINQDVTEYVIKCYMCIEYQRNKLKNRSLTTNHFLPSEVRDYGQMLLIFMRML